MGFARACRLVAQMLLSIERGLPSGVLWARVPSRVGLLRDAI